jgi:hypothetical protein
MAVGVRRSGFTLWVAWVAAAALSAAIVVSATPDAYMPIRDISAWLSALLIAAPLALLQFLILRGLLHVSSAAAGLWFGLTLAAAVAATAVEMLWWRQIVPMLTVNLGEPAFDIAGAEIYVEPLLLGLAQGVVLAMILQRKSAAVVWVAVSLAGFVLANVLFSTVMSPLPIDYRISGGRVLTMVVYRSVYAAITGAALFFLMVRRPTKAPGPAAR